MSGENPVGYSEEVYEVVRGAIFLGYAYGRFSEAKSKNGGNEPTAYQETLAEQFMTGRESFQAGTDKKTQTSLEALAKVKGQFPIVNNLCTKAWREMPRFMSIFLAEEHRPKGAS